MESAHIMYMWIMIVFIICACIICCNIIWANNDKNKDRTKKNTYQHSDMYDPDAMP